jgi:PncC family amidohydrolase
MAGQRRMPEEAPFRDPAVLAGDLIRAAGGKGLRVVTAESCTAGLVADQIAAIPGASKVLWGAFVAYTAEAKAAMLKVSAELIARRGAASREVALAMAEGALAASSADIAVSVTGLAGPDGDGSGVPVGTLWLAVARKPGSPEARQYRFSLSRGEFRLAAALEALSFLLEKV